MSNFIVYKNFIEYFLKYNTYPTEYFRNIFKHISGEKGLHRLEFAKYLDLNLLVNKSIFRIFSKNDYYTCDDFINCMEIIYSKNFDVAVAFVFTILDLDEEKIINRRNVEIMLYNIVGRHNQKILFSLIDELLNKFFDEDYMDYEGFRKKTECENSDLFFIIILYFLKKKPFECQAVDYFYCEDNTVIFCEEIIKPTDLIRYFMKDYDNLMKFLDNREIEEFVILNDDINLNYLPNTINIKNVFSDSNMIKPTRKNLNRLSLLLLENKIYQQSDEKSSSNEISTDSSIGNDSTNELEIYLLNEDKITKHNVLHYGKDIIDTTEQKILFNLSQSYIIYDSLQIKLINDQKHYQFILYNNGKLINIVSKNKHLCNEWMQRINRYADFKDFHRYYQIKTNLSSSKYNLVSVGVNLINNKEVIVKMFRKYKAGYSNLELFMTELDIMKNAKHPNLVEYIESFEDKDFIYIVMEKLQCSLTHYLNLKSITKQDINSIVYQIGCGLKYLHKIGVVHRDLKMDNVCIGNNVKIIDFGLSAYISHKQKHTLKCGTKLYISPEITLNQKYDQKTDIWSFGLVIYKIISYCSSSILKESEMMLNLNLESVIYNNSNFTFSNEWEQFKELRSIISACLCRASHRVNTDELMLKISVLCK